MFDLEVDPNLTVLVAPNASGKTNVIEAIQLLTAAESFRKPSWSDTIRWGSEQASLSLHGEGDMRAVDIRLDIHGNHRSYRLNGKVKRKISEVRGIIPSVIFTPDDLYMVKGSADKRRSSLDSLGDQITSAYEAIRGDYDKVLKHRNALLKNPTMPLELLDPWTEKLVEVGVAFFGHRKRLFDRLSPMVCNLYSILAPGEELTIEYVPSWGTREETPQESFRRCLEESLLQERVRGTTLVGPQRDELVFRLDGRDARAFASQGQQRTITLAWKLGEIEVMEDILGVGPVLLLDDVMSELDESRRDALTAFVGTRVQTFLTTTNTGYFSKELLALAKVVRL